MNVSVVLENWVLVFNHLVNQQLGPAPHALHR